jgi:predicted ATPase/DNA-binding CsgD family transcriptional regulator
LRDAIRWSYELLGPVEQAVFRRVAVFEGSFSLDAAERVCGDLGSPDDEARAGTLDIVTALVDKSLLQPADSASLEPRFAMLETIREFGLSELELAGEDAAAREVHARYILELAETAEGELTGPERGTWLARLHDERGNLRAALGWAREAGEPEIALRLGAALWRFWVSEGSLREGRGWLERALATDGEVGPAVRAKALHFLGNLALDLGDYPRARAPYEASLAIHRELEDRSGVAASLNGLGIVALEEGSYASARRLHEESLAIRKELSDRYGEALSHHNLGRTSTLSGDFAAARAHHESAMAIQRQENEEVGLAYSWWGLGEAVRREGQHDDARSMLEKALSSFHEVDDQIGLACALQGLAWLDAERDVPRAASRFAEALGFWREHGERLGMIESLEGIAALVAAQGELSLAVRWWSAAAAERHARHVPLPIVDQPASEQRLAEARARLGEAAYSAAWAAGGLVSLDDAVIEAIAHAPSIRGPVEEAEKDAYGLTDREREVLQLLVEGRTNHEIADALYISHRTVTSHVTNILGKLDVKSRTAAVSLAMRSNLV